MGFGLAEWGIILVIVVLLFGGKKIPQLGSSLGKAITNFKKGMNDDDKTKKEEDSSENKPS